jgi:hypothetical protein
MVMNCDSFKLLKLRTLQISLALFSAVLLHVASPTSAGSVDRLENCFSIHQTLTNPGLGWSGWMTTSRKIALRRTSRRWNKLGWEAQQS